MSVSHSEQEAKGDIVVIMKACVTQSTQFYMTYLVGKSKIKT